MTESTLYSTVVSSESLRKLPTVVLAITDPAWINQFQMLPQSWNLSYCRILVHSDPRWILENGVVETNFDILLTQSEKWRKLLPPHRVHVMPRHTKTDQGIMIAEWMKNRDTSSIRNPLTFASNLSDKKHPSHYGAGLKGKVVVKPEDGARGVCQMLVDFDEVSASPFLKSLYGPCTWTEFKTLYSTAEVVFSDGDLTNPEEAETIKKDGSFTFQQYVEDVKCEVRVLTDAEGKIGWMCHRRREGDIYKQATGVVRTASSMWTASKDEEWLTKMIGKDQVKLFEQFLKDVVGPMSSVDLFLTENKQWGVFEFCNQYGIAGVPADYYTASVKLFATRLVEKFWAMQ